MPNSVKSLGYIKCYSLSSPRPVKSPSNSIRHNSTVRGSAVDKEDLNDTGNQKEGHISLGDQQSYNLWASQRLH